jgi:mevalonate kinase
MTSRGFACGKAILFGEHAVVYGVPAIAVGIDRGAWADATVTGEGASGLHVRSWNLRVSEETADAPVARAFRDLVRVTREAGGLAEGAVHVEADADLPPGGGLGCSAALGVAVARALDPAAAPATVAARVNAWERVFHGKPSGIDAAVAALGGCVLFERTAAQTTIERVHAPRPLHFCIGNSGTASSTKSMVESVARFRERRPDIAKKCFDAIGTLVRNARLAIEAGDVRAVGQLLDLNQHLLAGLFLSTPELEQLCGSARAAGALGAKLTGAGGGGCVVALVDGPERANAVLAAWEKDGFEGFAATAFGELAQPAEPRHVVRSETSP